MTYQGNSYGTFLGAVYANLFPDQVRAMMLLGNDEPVGYTNSGDDNPSLNTALRQNVEQGTAKTLNAFLKLCGEQSTDQCAFSAGFAAARILTNPAYAGAFVYGRTRNRLAPDGRAVMTRLPREEWRIVVKDRYPPYIDWQTFERIQAMLRDNHAAYLRHGTRGIPRNGAALLQGIAWCGKCGHKLVVQYSNGNRYACTYLQRTQAAPVCQHLPADPIDACVVDAFFKAVAPAELEAWERAEVSRHQATEALERGAAQQLERLRYQALLAERQFNRVDPDTTVWSRPNWNVAGRWPCVTCAKPRRRWYDATPTALSNPA